jgi:hypothetical protein
MHGATFNKDPASVSWNWTELADLRADRELIIWIGLSLVVFSLWALISNGGTDAQYLSGLITLPLGLLLLNLGFKKYCDYREAYEILHHPRGLKIIVENEVGRLTFQNNLSANMAEQSVIISKINFLKSLRQDVSFGTLLT